MIVTFYSFKGGVGRSSCLVETALGLAARGHSVLVWDLDLEAPGLQKIPALVPLEETLTLGTLDLLLEFQSRDFAFPGESLRRAVVELPLSPPMEGGGGKLSFLLPGRLDDNYAGRFAEVEWDRLFAPEDGAGPAFFEKVATSLLDDGYELILVDSRTGFTPLSAICTLQLPHLVVLVFNLNEQNLAALERVHLAVTQAQSRARHTDLISAFLLANMVPDKPRALRQAKLIQLEEKGLRPHCIVPLDPARLLTDGLPALAGEQENLRPLIEQIETRQYALTSVSGRASNPSELDLAGRAIRRRREIFEKAKRFEEQVADLFAAQGYRPIVDYKRDDLQFDIRLEMAGLLPRFALVECKDTDRPIAQKEVRDFKSKVDYARKVESLPYEPILVSRAGFANNAHAVAKMELVTLLTWNELLLGYLRPNLDAAIRGFQGTSLERLYVEQRVCFERRESLGGVELEAAQPLTQAVLDWLARPGETLLALLGDFGLGKTSFCRRLAWKLALTARDQPGKGRIPVLVDLKKGISGPFSLENLLIQHFRDLSSQPFRVQELLHLNREGHLVLLFDGLDETLGYAEPGRPLDHLRQILRAAEGRAKVLLTCRAHYFRDRSEVSNSLRQGPQFVSSEGAMRVYDMLQGRTGMRIGHLAELNEEEIQQYLHKALPQPADWQAFREDIRRTYDLDDLAKRPFLLEMVVKTLPQLKAAEQGMVNLAGLYEAYCDSWANDSRLTLSREKKDELVKHLARLMWDSPGSRVHYSELFTWISDHFYDRPFTHAESEKIDYEVRTALFLHRDPEGNYRFIHRSFLEFFRARILRDGLISGEPASLAGQRLTREVVFFLEFWPEREKIPTLAGKVLEGAYRPGISENALTLLYLHSLAELGPLLGGEEKEVEREKLYEVFSKLRPETLHLKGADLERMLLAGADLSGADLREANLHRADLRGCTLDRARLELARLEYANLEGASAQEVDLSDANLTGVNGRQADFRGAQFAGADLSYGRFVEANFQGVNLEEAGILLRGAGFLRARLDDEESLDPAAGPVRPRSLKLRPPSPVDGRLALMPVHPDWNDPSKQRSRLGIVAVSWRPQGDQLASAAEDGAIVLWDRFSGRLLRSFRDHGGNVNSLGWSPQGDRLAAGSNDETVKLWETSTGRQLPSFHKHLFGVGAVAWDPSGRLLAASSDYGMVDLWEVSSGRHRRTFEGHEEIVNALAWAPDGQRLASASADGTVKIWETASNQPLTLQGHKAAVNAIAWNPAGDRLVSGSDDGTVKIWEADTVRVIQSHGPGGRVQAVFWDSSRDRWLSGDSEGTIRIWASSGRLLQTLQISVSVHSITVSSDGILAVGSNLGIELWDIRAVPRRLAWLYHLPGTGFAATADGRFVNAPAEAYEWIHFEDGEAVYTVVDLPDRLAREKVEEALALPESRKRKAKSSTRDGVL